MLKNILMIAGLSIPHLALAEDDSICSIAQSIVENVDFSPLEDNPFDERLYEVKSEFTGSKPKIQDGKIEISRYYGEDEGMPQQLWCKFKSQYAVKKSFPDVITGEVQSCGVMNQYIFERQLESYSLEDQEFVEQSSRKIIYLKDKQFIRGDSWIGSNVQIEENQEGDFLITSTTLKSSYWIPVIGGMRYCKFISPGEADHLINMILKDI